MTILDWIQQYNGAITAVTAVIVAWLTAVLAIENRRLRRAGTEPDVVAYLLPDQRHLNLLHLVVANVGRGPARNVAIELDADPADFAAHGLKQATRTRRPLLSILPQDERVHQFFGSAFELLAEPPLQDFTIRVHFEDMAGKRRTTSSHASVKDFEGFTTAGTPPEYVTAEALNKIADQVSGWSSGFQRLKVEIISAKEEEKRRDEARERALTRRKKEKD